MRFPSRHRGAVVVLPLLATLSSGAAQAEVNIVPVEVRQSANAGKVNKLFVDVTVCNAKQQCRTVPDVLVDTGSPGLRLSRQALHGLDLDAVTVLDNRPLGNWSHFSSGDLWGTIHWARVRIGGVETTEAIPIEVFAPASPDERLPAGYGRPDLRDHLATIVGNGILGISPLRYSPEGYFAFAGASGATSKSDWARVKINESLQLANPIGHFPAPYNNGSVISLPEVDTSKGQKTVQGWLGFGIGLPTEMLFPKGSRVISHELDQRCRFPAKVSGRGTDVMVDSGTNVMYLNLEHLGFTRGESQAQFYDPKAPTPVDLTVMCAGQEVKLARSLEVGPAANLMKIQEGYAVLPMMAAWTEPKDVVPGKAEGNLLGLPFFFGRTVATGLQGAVNPFAPLVPEAAPATLPEAGFEIVEDYVDHASRHAAAPAESLAAGADSDGFELVTHSPNGFVAYTD